MNTIHKLNYLSKSVDEHVVHREMLGNAKDGLPGRFEAEALFKIEITDSHAKHKCSSTECVVSGMSNLPIELVFDSESAVFGFSKFPFGN